MTTVRYTLELPDESYNVCEVEVEGGRYCQLLLDEGIALGEPGEPELPIVRVSLAVPGRIVDPEEVNLYIETGETVEIPLEAPLWPIQPPSLPQEEGLHELVLIEGPDGEPISYYKPEPFMPPKPEAYKEPVPHPEMVARVASVEPGMLVSVVHLWVAPFHYFPVEQFLLLTREIHLNLDVETVEAAIVQQVRELAEAIEVEGPSVPVFPLPEPDLDQPFPVDDAEELGEIDKSLVQFLLTELRDRLGSVVNYKVVEELYKVLEDSLRSPLIAQLSSRPYWPYIIITDDFYWLPDGTRCSPVSGITAEFQRLADWKTQKGLPARVVTVQDIWKGKLVPNWNASFIRDVPEAIREFLKYARRWWGTRWVLLGGDIEIVPGRRIVWIQSFNKIKPRPPGTPEESKTFTAHSIGQSLYRLEIALSRPLPYYGSGQNAREAYHSLIPETLPVFFSEKTHRKFEYNEKAGQTVNGNFITGWCYAKDNTFTNRWTRYPMKYVLLYGATDEERKRILFFADHDTRWCLPVTDAYYSSLIGSQYDRRDSQGNRLHDWDIDGIHYYGLSDTSNPKEKVSAHYPDVGGVHWDHFDIQVGRAPVYNVQEARAFVDRVLTVDRLQTLGNQPVDTRFTKRLLLFAGFEGNDRSGEVDPYAIRAGRIHHLFIKEKANLSEIERFYSDHQDYWNHRDWGGKERTWMVVQSPKAEDMAAATLAWNRGYGHVSVQAHGGTKGTCRGFINQKMLPNINNDPAYSVVYAYSCSTAHFDDYRGPLGTNHRQYYPGKLNRQGDWVKGITDQFWRPAALAESVVTRSGGGAAAYIGESRAAWMYIGVQELFWQRGLCLLQRGQIPTVGAMFASMGDFITVKQDRSSRTARAIIQLFGDPEMTVWFGYTGKMKLFAPVTVQSNGKVHIEVHDSQGNGFSSCRICLWQKGILPLIVYSNSLGVADVQLKGVAQGTTIYVTVTGAIHRPEFAEIKVT